MFVRFMCSVDKHFLSNLQDLCLPAKCIRGHARHLVSAERGERCWTAADGQFNY